MDNQYLVKTHPRHGEIVTRVLHELWSSVTNMLKHDVINYEVRHAA